MALNERQSVFISEIKSVSNDMQNAYQKIKELAEHFDEEFATNQDNALDNAGVTSDLTAMGLDYSAITAAINQGFDNFINFWEGNAVNTREYGKDIRRIAN